MEKSYAQALWYVVEKGTAPAEAVHALREALVRSGREALMPRIAKAFAILAQRESEKKDVVLMVAREGDERAAHKDAKRVLAELGMDVQDLKTRVDDSLIGGWRLEGSEMLVDQSYKSELLSMYNRATNA